MCALVYSIVILSGSLQFQGHSQQNQLELSESAFGYVMHCYFAYSGANGTCCCRTALCNQNTQQIKSIHILWFILYLAPFPFRPLHDDVIKWKHFPRYWPFVRGIHRSPVNSPRKGQWPWALMFSLICACINSWVNNRKAGDLRRYRAHFHVTVMVNHFK